MTDPYDTVVQAALEIARLRAELEGGLDAALYDALMGRPATPAASVQTALRHVGLALEQAQLCLLGETPELRPSDGLRANTLDAVRAALFRHLPTIRAALAEREP